MEKILNKIAKISSLASRYIGIIIIAFSCVAFFWRDGFAWMTNYTSVFLGVIMFGMGLTIKMEDFRIVFSRPKEVVIGAVAQYTIMPVVAKTQELINTMTLFQNRSYYPDMQAASVSVNDPMEMLQDIRKCCGSQNRRQIDQITNLMATIQMMKIMNENPPGGDNP